MLINLRKEDVVIALANIEKYFHENAETEDVREISQIIKSCRNAAKDGLIPVFQVHIILGEKAMKFFEYIECDQEHNAIFFAEVKKALANKEKK